MEVNLHFRFSAIMITMVLIFSFTGYLRAEINVNSPAIKWQTYSNEPFDNAKINNKLILLYSKSPSCHWCQQMDKTTWQDPKVIQLVKDNFIPVLIKVDTQPDLVMKYNINSLPTILILDAQNHILKIFSGYFSADYMEDGLKDILAKNSGINQGSSSTPISNTDQDDKSLTFIPTTEEAKLKENQLKIMSTAEKNYSKQNINFDSIQYALLFSNDNNQLVMEWIKTVLDSQQATIDKVWGGIFNDEGNYQKTTDLQAKELKTFTDAYVVLNDPAYLATAKSIVNYIFKFLTSPEGAFYSSQESYKGVEAETYYKLDDQQRHKLGLPLVNTHIYAATNGLMINALANYYMASGDNASLENALKATHWIIDNLSIPGGGFRHELKTNNVINLNDTLAMGEAYIALYKATQSIEYLKRAASAAGFINKYFQNPLNDAGFVMSIDLNSTDNNNLHMNADENGDIVRFATQLFNYTGDKEIQKMQLRAFNYVKSSENIDNDLPALTLLAEKRIKNNPLHVTIVGSKNLYVTATAHTLADTRLDWWDKAEGPMQNADTVYEITAKPAAYVCHGFQCSFPAYDSPELISMLKDINLPSQVKIEKNLVPESSNIKVQLNNLICNPAETEKLLIKHNWIIIILGFVGFGLLISFTPCILPLVPIMASIIVGNTIGVKKEKTFLLCLVYVLSMSFTYSILGVLAGAFGLYLQIYMQNAVVLILFSIVFLALALSMLGVYELTLPKAMQQKISKWSNLQKGGTFIGVTCMGILSTLIISPCVSAPLAGVLSYITKNGDYILGAISMFFMGLGMGLPLLIITIFSKNILPKASQWNNQIKHFFGLILLAASIWIASRVIPETSSMILWSSYIILTSIYMGITNQKVVTLFDKFWKVITIMFFVFGISLFWEALIINSDLYNVLQQKLTAVPILSNSSGALEFKNVKNLDDLTIYIDAAKKKHLPILLDFTAKWCSVCTYLDHNILSNPEIHDDLTKFVLLRVDLTDVNSESLKIAHEFQMVGPPLIIFIDEQGKLLNIRILGDVDLNNFKGTLQQILAPKANANTCYTSIPSMN
jgi:thiol:disulfide interchange protein DsbD